MKNKKNSGSRSDPTSEERLEKERAEFTAIASHELRTPLSLIEGYLHFILDNKYFKYDKQTREYLIKVHKSTLELIELTKNILTVSKENAGDLKINISEINLIETVEDIVKKFKTTATQKGLLLKLKVSGDLQKIRTDLEKLVEILTNLLDNACKFTEKGGVIVTVEREGKTIVFAIKDTGIGIDEASRERIFEKFYRAEDWQTRKTGGTGLGLYICKSLAEKLGGEITLASEKNVGSVFTFILPLRTKNR